MDVFEAIGTATAMRWLKPDPVPDDLLEKVLWAGTRASNPGNSQPWDFVVVRSPEQRARVAEAIARPKQDFLRNQPSLPEDASTRAIVKGAHHLLSTLHAAPILIFVCGRNVYPAHDPVESMMFSALHAASQNMLLASRALGLGAVFTTVHQGAEDPLREILGIPPDCHIGVTMPLGWPERPFTQLRRRPLQEVVHVDHWQTSPADAQ